MIFKFIEKNPIKKIKPGKINNSNYKIVIKTTNQQKNEIFFKSQTAPEKYMVFLKISIYLNFSIRFLVKKIFLIKNPNLSNLENMYNLDISFSLPNLFYYFYEYKF